VEVSFFLPFVLDAAHDLNDLERTIYCKKYNSEERQLRPISRIIDVTALI
jgi:hypothetical protein